MEANKRVQKKILALRKAFDEVIGEYEQDSKEEKVAPRTRQNKKIDRQMRMAINFHKYNK